MIYTFPHDASGGAACANSFQGPFWKQGETDWVTFHIGQL